MKPLYYKYLLYLSLIIVWISHFIQVFVPETGFDALWYHLPMIKEVVTNKQLVYIPELYQSVNPLFSDLIFGIGYYLLNDIGTKIIAYLFSLGLIGITYVLSRKYLNKHWSLLLILLVSTFQVISWQSASFYVDLPKAFFELCSLFVLYKLFFDSKNKTINTNLHSKVIFAGLLFGASLATKLFSLFLLPVYLLLIYLFSIRKKFKNTLIFLLSSFILPLPFYIFAFIKTGNPFYSLMIHINKLGEIGGESSIINYLISRTTKLPYSVFELFLSKDYVSFIFLVFLPIVIYNNKKLFIRKNLFLFIFSISQYLLWWYLPPTSSRYAISGFIVLTILYFKQLEYFIKQKKEYLLPIVLTILLSVIINFAPRLIVNLRSIKYITKKQSKHEYLKQFLDGSIDNNIKEWHFNTTLYQF